MDSPQPELGQQPVFLPGVGAHWTALQLWRGPSRLKELCGDVAVQVMISRQELFVGDMQHLMLLETPFADFLDGRLDLSPPPGGQKQQGQEGERQTQATGGAPCTSAPPPPAASGAAAVGAHAESHRLYAYLAQCPIGLPAPDRRSFRPGPLHALLADVEVPALLQGRGVNQVNFWASTRKSRSSLHYDPYLNLLVVAQGVKTVLLVPPDTTPLLAPQPIYHESANHSPADLAAPDLERFPGLARALAKLQTFTLQPGDGLYIPEGWWHQVESEAGTLAVNFWWESAVSHAFGGCTDRYYFRRLAQSLLEHEKQRLLASVVPLNLDQLAAALPAAASAGGATPAAAAVGAGAKDDGWPGRALSAREEAAVWALASMVLVAGAGAGDAEPAADGEAAAAEAAAGAAPTEHGHKRDQAAARGQQASHLEPHAHAHHHHHHSPQQAVQARVQGLIAALAAEPGDEVVGSKAAAAAAAPAAGGAEAESSPTTGEGGGPAVIETEGEGGGAVGPAGGAEPLLRVLLALRGRHPAAAHWLLLEGLGPLGWELLLGRLEAAEAAAAEAHGPATAHERFASFYDRLYSVAGGQAGGREALLGVLLGAKEALALAALRGVLRDELGVHSSRFFGAAERSD